MKLLEKARILNRLMQNGERVKYKEVALLLRNLISSNVYVIDIDGKIMGYGLLDEFECDVMRDMVLVNQRFPEKYMEFVKETTETRVCQGDNGNQFQYQPQRTEVFVY